MNNGSKQVLLAVLAHPDDESFGIGGTLALYAKRGVEVHLVCATRGEVGDVEPELLEGFDSVSQLREHELRCAANILGLAGVHFLDYRDSGMPGSADNQHPLALAAAPTDEVAAKIAQTMRRLRPQVVLTEDPIGTYKHPDHIAIHKATLKAFHLAGDPNFDEGAPPFQPQKLYYIVFPKGMLRLATKLLPLIGQDPRRFGRNNDIDLVDLAGESDFPNHIRIDYNEVADLRDAAAACHASQLPSGPPNSGLIGWVMRLFRGKENFMRAIPEAAPNLRERDLFEGVQY